MSKAKRLSPKAEWIELVSEKADWDKADPAMLGTMLSSLHLIRAFEEKVLDLVGEGLVHGPAHSSIGQEGGAVGSALALRVDDQVNGSHRGHHQFLAKALNYATRGVIEPDHPIVGDTRGILYKTLAEILGLAPGYCKGRGGSMHLRWVEAGGLGTNAIVGGGVPLALGAAFAHKHSNTDAIAVSYFGEGAINIGSVLESFNLAAAWKLPVLFFVENNRYAVATHVEEVTAEPSVSARGPGFGIPSWRVDGMDPLAVLLATQAAVAGIRSGAGPAIIEADVYRYFHQSGPMPGSAFGYRTKQEEAEWKKRDPLDRVADNMLRRGLITREGIENLRHVALQTMAELADELTERTEGNKRKIRPSLWPSPDFIDVGIRGDLSELNGVRVEEQASYTGQLVDRKFVDAIADVIGRRMESDPRVVVLGEDVHRLKGGTNGATRGLKDRFPERVLGTPISEAAFLGLGTGMAMDGRFRPIVEFMYPDFMWVAADQVFNQAGKARHMFGGESAVPLVLRTKVAMGTGYGSQHSMDPAGVVSSSPGWRIIAPSTPFDYVGLMNTALACNDPVLVIEHVDLYQQSMPVAADDLDYFIPFGKAAVRRTGSKATILTYLSMVHRAIEAADELGADVEIIDLRSLDRASLDWKTISDSVIKTNNVIIVEQGARGTSWGGWLADEIQRRLFDWLDQPVQRVTGGEASPSISKVLERAAFAGKEEISASLREFVR
ncbi:alpha-ketoacid dehydrogenase subunit alpha/beta [Mesorhizobium sp. NZP2298]|uniref:alpha-ketoacid dehydrogenase subunit alpha/beta n=1 Tax=Mesorhizobium sp. NZP2298 TaxID=2483403 RepID=UPI001557A2A3|nr:alpha-ketoacid dehydrogenase subunit alpha/beta [Mesorhizobium sp. NZP2298]QKC98342.1 MFS transporter [Mesorhizobium sp. NZP2298]